MTDTQHKTPLTLLTPTKPPTPMTTPTTTITAAIAAIMMLSILVIMPVSYAEIKVIQENLTEAEQKTLDDIAKARADGTYIPPPEANLTANIRVYSDNVTISVTHPVDLDAMHCWTSYDTYVPTTQCILPGFPPHPEDQYFDTDLQEWRPVEELKEAFAAEQKAEAEQGKTDAQIYNEFRIDYIKQRNNPTPLELEELNLREQIGALCKNDTLVSQKYREFDVSTEIYLDHEGVWREQLKVDRSANSDTFRENRFVLDLKKQVQECIGQPHTKKSVQYDHIVVDGLYSKDPNRPEAPDAITASMVNEDANAGIVTSNAVSLMCNSHNSATTKEMYGCPPSIPDPSTIETPELKDYRDATSYQKWLQYQENPGMLLEEYIKNSNEAHRAKTYGGQ